jgi:6-pyruvoyltetrahydropterin/6-carboxytetrahydropterin synthase
MYTVERYHDISAGHRVVGGGKCENLHGHNYRIYFTVAPESRGVVEVVRDDGRSHESIYHPPKRQLDDRGMVIDFGVVKTTLCDWLEEVWDHKMLLWEEDPMCFAIHAVAPEAVVEVAFNPTAENMARYLVEVVGPLRLKGTGVRLVRVRVEETRKCSATFALPGY